MRIPCPYCGERDIEEFAYLGDATRAAAAIRPRRRRAAAFVRLRLSARQSARAASRALVSRARLPRAGSWSRAIRARTRSLARGVRGRARGARRVNGPHARPFASRAAASIDRAQHAVVHLRRPAPISGYRRRHAGLGAAGQRRAPGRPLLQVSPPARHPHGRARRSRTRWSSCATGARREPNTRATTVELYDGLDAASQNRWPSLRFDLLAVNSLLAPILSAPASTTRPSCGRRRSGRRSTSR